jgi:hypothetical protein
MFQCQANSKMRRYIGMRAVGGYSVPPDSPFASRAGACQNCATVWMSTTKHLQPPTRMSPLHASIWKFQLRLPFCVFEAQSDGSPQFVESVQTLDDAKARVQALGELWPGEDSHSQ